MNKTQFKLILDSNIAASFTGTQFNAKYYVDFKDIISNDADLDKSYYVYVTFKSICSTIAGGNFSNEALYLLNLDFGKGTNTSKFNTVTSLISNPTNITHILPLTCTLEKGSTIPQLYFELYDNDQTPTIINNIRSLNFIRLNVLLAFNSTNNVIYGSYNPTHPGNVKYVCILSFVEM